MQCNGEGMIEQKPKGEQKVVEEEKEEEEKVTQTQQQIICSTCMQAVPI